MRIFITYIAALLSLLWFSCGSLGSVLVGTSDLHPQVLDTVAYVENEQVSYVTDFTKEAKV